MATFFDRFSRHLEVILALISLVFLVCYAVYQTRSPWVPISSTGRGVDSMPTVLSLCADGEPGRICPSIEALESAGSFIYRNSTRVLAKQGCEVNCLALATEYKGKVDSLVDLYLSPLDSAEGLYNLRHKSIDGVNVILPQTRGITKLTVDLTNGEQVLPPVVV